MRREKGDERREQRHDRIQKGFAEKRDAIIFLKETRDGNRDKRDDKRE